MRNPTEGGRAGPVALAKRQRTRCDVKMSRLPSRAQSMAELEAEDDPPAGRTDARRTRPLKRWWTAAVIAARWEAGTPATSGSTAAAAGGGDANG
jgi:hypothetical protein